MEFFIFGVANKNDKGPKDLTSKLATLTGYLPMAPYHSFGFHYSKWEPIDTSYLISLLNDFNKMEMPLDNLWLDIDYADGRRYFVFDKNNFRNFNKFLDLIEQQKKRVTIITDPHIKIDPQYKVYKEGRQYKVANDEDGNPIRGVFIRDHDCERDFHGECWPEASVWVDFLNENAQKYWASLYRYDKFIGTNKLFNYWIDMNEPSVFSEDELTMPKKTIHITKDNVQYYHKDVHNAYGILMAKASYDGILNREMNGNLRPFLLSRSVFFGS